MYVSVKLLWEAIQRFREECFGTFLCHVGLCLSVTVLLFKHHAFSLYVQNSGLCRVCRSSQSGSC